MRMTKLLKSGEKAVKQSLRLRNGEKFLLVTDKEKMEIVKLFREAIRKSKQLDKWKEILKRIYPKLYYWNAPFKTDSEISYTYYLLRRIHSHENTKTIQ